MNWTWTYRAQIFLMNNIISLDSESVKVASKQGKRNHLTSFSKQNVNCNNFMNRVLKILN